MALSAVVATSLLLPRAWPGLPAASYRGPGHFAQSTLELAVGLALSLGLAGWILRRRRTRRGAPAAPRGDAAAVGGGSIEG